MVAFAFDFVVMGFQLAAVLSHHPLVLSSGLSFRQEVMVRVLLPARSRFSPWQPVPPASQRALKLNVAAKPILKATQSDQTVSQRDLPPVGSLAIFPLRAGEITGLYLGRFRKVDHGEDDEAIAHRRKARFIRGQNLRHEIQRSLGKRSGMCPKDPIFGYLTPCLQPQGLRGLPEKFVDDRANQLLELFSLHGSRWAPISAYSKGMKQRILIAAALLHDPDLLIFGKAIWSLCRGNSLLFRQRLRALTLCAAKAVLANMFAH